MYRNKLPLKSAAEDIGITFIFLGMNVINNVGL